MEYKSWVLKEIPWTDLVIVIWLIKMKIEARWEISPAILNTFIFSLGR